MQITIEERIKGLLNEVVPHAKHEVLLDQGMSLRSDLGIDSIGLMSLAFRLEEEFSIDLTEHAEEVAMVESVGDVVRFIGKVIEA